MSQGMPLSRGQGVSSKQGSPTSYSLSLSHPPDFQSYHVDQCKLQMSSHKYPPWPLLSKAPSLCAPTQHRMTGRHSNHKPSTQQSDGNNESVTIYSKLVVFLGMYFDICGLPLSNLKRNPHLTGGQYGAWRREVKSGPGCCGKEPASSKHTQYSTF